MSRNSVLIYGTILLLVLSVNSVKFSHRAIHFETLIESSTHVPLKVYEIKGQGNEVLDVRVYYKKSQQKLKLGLYEIKNHSLSAN